MKTNNGSKDRSHRDYRNSPHSSSGTLRARETAGSFRITDLAEDERPRERLAEAGAAALSKAELLAILLRVGLPGENSVQLAQRILDELGGLSGIQRASVSEMCSIHGDVIASNGPPQHAEGHPRQSRRKGGISGGEVPALRIVHPGVEEGVPLTFEENFLIPADKPDKVDVIAHPAQNGISEVKGQRVGHG